MNHSGTLDSVKALCVIADLVDSRGIADRGRFQRGLKASLEALSSRRGARLLSPYTITLGDEFQALYRDSGTLLADFAWLAWAIFPLRARLSAAYDDISTDINVREALGMDGPAFHAARDALKGLKAEKRMILDVSWPGSPWVALVNASLRSFAHGMEGWNATAVCAFAGLMNGLSVDEVAEEAGVTQRMVYKAMATRGLRDAAALFAAVTAGLGRLEKEPPGRVGPGYRPGRYGAACSSPWAWSCAPSRRTTWSWRRSNASQPFPKTEPGTIGRAWAS